MLRKEDGHKIDQLNTGLRALKASDAWATFCAVHPDVPCDMDSSTVSLDSDQEADITLMVEPGRLLVSCRQTNSMLL